ncbi:MAG: multicopper oxidase domain-containing protein [Terracidiphilus sp.]|nr:multicopper oxidase domain-containing protein [Terracidiphilus sp.]
MTLTKRRDFLRLCIASAPALAFAHGQSDVSTSLLAVQPAYRKPGLLERYIDPLPVPKKLIPQSTGKDGAQYLIRILEFTQQMHSQLPPTKLWGYEGQYPGPTIEAQRGVPILVQWENHLPLRHIFAIDPHIHGAMPPAPEVRTVAHLHGACTRSESDGLPEKWITPGDSTLCVYPNSQQPTTLWYHDQAVGISRLNVYAGLAGFFLLRDEEEARMDLPSGNYEVPLLLQDRTLDEKGQLVYAPTFDDGQNAPPHFWGPEIYGDLPVVNGAIYPYLQVEPRRYRLRLLNGANARFFNLFFNLAKHPTDIPSLVPFHQIGTDGGFIPNPVALNKLLLAPAERADLIVDFSGLEGKIVTLSNDAPAPFPGWGLIKPHHLALPELMQFRVTLPVSSKRASFSMPPPRPLPKMNEAASIATRDFVLSEGMDTQGRSLGEQINAKGHDDPVTEIVKLGSIEKWRFINTTKYAHPMHLHLLQFQILQRDGFDPIALRNGTLAFVGTPRFPAANENGWKDTAVVSPQEVLTILVRVEGYTGRYVFHSTLLEHEDKDMMRPYEVVPAELKLQNR